ncbi:MAG TPA: hypothetical protein VFT95_21395, partial [Micromonosporaceae bacterium]|nr:hypothetical protein [Micromonosporaceae bacterium]
TPALAQQPDRRVHLAAQHLDSNVWARTQSAVGGPEWSGWGRMGGSMAASPAVGRLPDGTLVQFAVDADGRLWHLRQGGPNGAYGSWRGLGDADLVGTPTVVTLENALQLVALDAAGAVRTATYFVDGGLSAWTSLGGTGLTGTPAAVVYPGFRLRVFVRGADGAVLTKAQDGGGAFPADWTPVGEPVAAGSPAAVLNPATARTEVIVRGPGGSVLLSRETAQGSGQWEPWFPLPMGGATAATDPTVLTYTNSNGSTYLFAARDADNVFRVWIPGPSDPRDAQPGYAGTTLPEVTS